MIDLYKALTGLKEMDVERAQACLDEAGVSIDDFAAYVLETGVLLEALDIVALAYTFIAESADMPELYDFIYPNYAATRFDIAAIEGKKILGKVAVHSRNEAWFWVREKALS